MGFPIQHIDRAPGREDRIGTLRREATAGEEGVGRGRAGVGHAIPLIHRSLQVGQGPERSRWGGNLRATHTARRVLMQPGFQIGRLGRCAFPMVATQPLVAQGGKAVLLVGVTTWHEATAAETGDGVDGGNGKAQSVQPHGLDAGARGAVAFLELACLEGSGGFWC